MTGAGYNPRVAVGLQALSVALRAQSDGFDALDVEPLVTQAQQLLPSDDPVCRAVTAFATAVEIAAPEQLPAIGRELTRAIEVASMPVPPDQHRADIHG